MSNLPAIVKNTSVFKGGGEKTGILRKIGTVLKNNKGKAALLGLGALGIGLLLAGGKDDKKQQATNIDNAYTYQQANPQAYPQVLAYNC